VPRAELPAILRRLRAALIPGGCLVPVVQYGRGERQAGDRRFTDMDEEGLHALLAETGGLTMLSMEVTNDVRPDRAHDRWLGVICRRDA
jgi:hypothetical protein